MTFEQALIYLQGPGVNVALGIVLSFAVEYIPKFCGLSQQAKRLWTGAIALVIPLAACGLSILMGYQPASFELSWWPALVAGGAAFAAATLAHVRKLDGQAPPAVS